ncbi:EAL domain-containing protein [Thermodesulfovibrio hydrogeniphilus]
MDCKVCTTTPEIPDGIDKLVITASHPYMLQKIVYLLGSVFEIQKFEKHLELKTRSMEFFINSILNDNSFTEVEIENIHILPIKEGDEINIEKLPKFKPLSYWISLFKGLDLKWILDNERIIIYFQPIIDLKNFKIYGYECLARGLKKDGSIMNPREMFTLAERTKMLFNLDRQCRIQAINYSKKHGLGDFYLFINFNPGSIYNPEFCLSTTINAIKGTKMSPEKIVFEVIETERVQNISHLCSIFDHYRRNRLKVALDDIGSGFSSLLMLKELKPDYMKIDMELIRNIDINPHQRSIVKALVDISNDLGIITLAEGIETKEELEVVTSLGISLGQGYLFGRPSPEPTREVCVL